MELFYISLAAWGGGILAALLGWLKSGEKFNARHFAPSVLTAFLAGGSFAIAYAATGAAVTALSIIVAVLAGAGVDSGVNRLVGAFTAPKT